jgi:hypothetical protein
VAQEATEVLIEVVEGDDDTSARIAAVYTLGLRIRGSAPRVIRALDRASKDDARDLRLEAARVLGKCRPDPDEVVPILLRALKDQDWEVRFAAVEAVGRIGAAAKATIPTLIELLDDEKVATSAVIALGRMGPLAAEAIPALEKARGSTDHIQASHAAEALTRIRERNAP